MAMVKKAKTKKEENGITEWKQKKKKRKWSWTEGWVKIERTFNMIHNSCTRPPHPPPPPKKKDCFLDCENAITNSVMINYSWQENEKFAREMLHLFTYTAKNKMLFYHGLYYKVRRLARAWKYPFDIHWVLYCFHCTHKRPFWDLKENNFPLSRPGYFPSHDDMQISLTVFLIDGTNLLPVTPPPTKKKTTAKNK